MKVIAIASAKGIKPIAVNMNDVASKTRTDRANCQPLSEPDISVGIRLGNSASTIIVWKK